MAPDLSASVIPIIVELIDAMMTFKFVVTAKGAS